MNEPVTKLWEQAAQRDDLWEQARYERFAELLIKECIGVVEKLSPGYDDYRNQIEDAFRRDCVEELKQYFGIKE